MELHGEGAVQESHGEGAVMEMKRRDFLKGAAISMLGMTSLGVLGGCSSPAAAEGENAAAPTVSTTTDTSGRRLTLEEVNALRKEIVDSKGDYTCADGTVIPAVYVKLRALIDTIGMGLGSAVTDTSFQEVMFNFSEEDAQAYLEMPCGVFFTATEFSVVSGRDEAECLAIAEDLASRGLLFRVRRGGVPRFHLLAEAHGIWEYNMFHYTADYVGAHAASWGTDVISALFDSETPFYYAVPVNKEVVADEEILPYDDYEKIIRRNTVLSVSPCQCRSSRAAAGTNNPDCTHPLETCIATGEEAEYYLENGIGRAITQDEALEILHRNVELGMVIQSAYTKDTEVICSCHGDCCDILGTYVALNGEVGNSMANVSHYTLRHDKEACVKCGACAARCPLFAVTMDADGYPVADAKCVRCGQCGTVCPAGARKLVQKDDLLELPQSMLDDYNEKSEYRISRGRVY